MENLGIIAGEGDFPVIISRQLAEKGSKPKIAAIKNLTDETISQFASGIVFLKLGEVKKAIDFFKTEKIKTVIMAGRVRHASIFDIKPDLTAVKILARAKDKRADTILRAVCESFEKEGIKIVSSVEPLKDFLFEEKIYTKRKPTKKEIENIKFAEEIAHKISDADIGQTVAVKDKVVVAVEAMEGTDACILRAGRIAGSGCVIVKTARAKQDFRFDVPVVGIRTIKKLAEAKASALAAQAKATLFFDREEAVKLSNETGISIIGIK
ncbi:MAG: UDP-2,3-diacylglucosamine diphosphatase LpxI [Elusimicrobia bacterium]|nr:UDP-2,3-diacylglucosamine diphosphatase LpxI [Elusimicrobiota bacterium]